MKLYSKKEVLELFSKYHKEKLSLYDYSTFLIKEGVLSKDKYQSGDFVRWNGFNPTVGIIDKRKDYEGSECYKLKKTTSGKVDIHTSCNIKCLTKITGKEYKEAIIAKAIELGYVNGATVKCLFNGENGVISGRRTNFNNELYFVDKIDYELWVNCGVVNSFIFDGEEWAEIIIATQVKEDKDGNTVVVVPKGVEFEIKYN